MATLFASTAHRLAGGARRTTHTEYQNGAEKHRAVSGVWTRTSYAEFSLLRRGRGGLSVDLRVPGTRGESDDPSARAGAVLSA